jgi:hypothetical protein
VKRAIASSISDVDCITEALGIFFKEGKNIRHNGTKIVFGSQVKW